MEETARSSFVIWGRWNSSLTTLPRPMATYHTPHRSSTGRKVRAVMTMPKAPSVPFTSWMHPWAAMKRSESAPPTTGIMLPMKNLVVFTAMESPLEATTDWMDISPIKTVRTSPRDQVTKVLIPPTKPPSSSLGQTTETTERAR